MTEENKKADYLSSFNIAACSQLTTSSTSQSPRSNHVYYRRRIQKKCFGIFSTKLSLNTKTSYGCISVLSSEAPSIAVEEHACSQAENEAEDGKTLAISFSTSNRGPLTLMSDNTCSIAKEHVSSLASKVCSHKGLEFSSLNDSCSSSKSTVEPACASLRTEIDDTCECSSSDALVVEAMGEDISEKDLCISILESQGLLKRVWPIKVHDADHVDNCSDRIQSQTCKLCGHSEISLKMLICDHCEEAFHISCCNSSLKKISMDEWLCQSCLKKKPILLKEATCRKSSNIDALTSSYRNLRHKGEGVPIASMLSDIRPYTTGVRIGKAFQADVPDWAGPIINDEDIMVEPVEIDYPESRGFHELNSKRPHKFSSIGNWVQCREIVDGVREGTDGTICGKWRRAPLFEVQTDNWECFRCVLWDPTHADCAVPQELETSEVLKQLKYIEMLRPRLAAKRQKTDPVDGSCREYP